MSGDDLSTIQSDLADLRRAVDALKLAREQDRRDLPGQVREIVTSILQNDMPQLVRAETAAALREELPPMLKVHDDTMRTREAAANWETLTGFMRRLGWAVILAFGAGAGGSLFLAVRMWLQ